MKLTAYILQKDNSIIKRKIKNPSNKFEVSYTVDGEEKDYPYKFNRKKIFSNKKFFGKENISFYEHGSVEPLTPAFKTDTNVIDEIYALGESKLINQLVDSAKSKDKVNYFFMLGVLGIIGLVLIVVFG